MTLFGNSTTNPEPATLVGRLGGFGQHFSWTPPPHALDDTRQVVQYYRIDSSIQNARSNSRHGKPGSTFCRHAFQAYAVTSQTSEHSFPTVPLKEDASNACMIRRRYSSPQHAQCEPQRPIPSVCIIDSEWNQAQEHRIYLKPDMHNARTCIRYSSTSSTELSTLCRTTGRDLQLFPRA